MASIFTSDLKEGMTTSLDCFSTSGKLILPQNTIITKGIINKLLENDVLFIDILDESSNIDEPIDLSLLTNEMSIDTSITETVAFKKFNRRYTKQITNLQDNFNDIIYKNGKIDVDVLVKTTSLLISDNSPLGLLNMLSNLKDYDDSTFNHCINVALICNILGSWLNLSPEDIKLVTLSGLLHDIGKLLIPDKIIKKPGKLTDEEYKIVKTHSKKGYDILKKSNLPLCVQYAALMHHERCDGTGYPLKLVREQIDWCAQIVAIADVYDAMTSKRVYRGALSPFSVINFFEEDGLRKYNPKYLMTFLDNVVNSFMNCKVKLSNGDEGDIVYINRVNLSKPMIKCNDKFIDLSTQSNVSIDSIL